LSQKKPTKNKGQGGMPPTDWFYKI